VVSFVFLIMFSNLPTLVAAAKPLIKNRWKDYLVVEKDGDRKMHKGKERERDRGKKRGT
jgi:hypothetical protein